MKYDIEGNVIGFGDFPTLETERLLLRRMTLDDIDFYIQHFSAPDIVRLTLYDAPADLGTARHELKKYCIDGFLSDSRVLLMCAVAFYAGYWTGSGREARGTVCAGLGAGVEPEARWWLRGFFGTSFLCGLMRPEGFTVAALLTAVLLVYGGLRRRHLVELAPFLVALAVYLVAKSVTLGNVLPNSFHLKIGQVDALVPGADFVIRFLDTFGTWLTLGALGILLIKPTEGARRIWIGLIVVLCFFLVFYVRTLPLMAWQHRYLIPYVFIPALGSAAVIGFGGIDEAEDVANDVESIVLKNA